MRYPKIAGNFKPSQILTKDATIEQIKINIQKRHKDFYHSFEYAEIGPLYYENTYSGNNLRIMGSIPDDFRSSIAVLSTLENFQPDVIILGERNKFDFDRMRGKLSFDMLPRLYTGNENLLAKTEFSKFYSKEFKQNLEFFKVAEENLIYKANINRKTLHSDDYMSAAYNASLSIDVALLFGKPDPTLFIEDLVLRYSLEDLQGIFERCINGLKERYSDSVSPYTENEIIFQNFREVTKDLEKATLYQKSLIYQASLLKKCTKSYKNSYLITSNYFPKEIEVLM